jgi:glycosyltransferase involved in cell wall biosynthesis
VLFVGRLSAEKNLPLLLRGFALFAKERRGGRLMIVGTGREEGALKNLAASLGISKQVEFSGQRSHSELGGWYQAADVFVLPSTLETQGMVAVEAMFFSKPVLVSNAIVSANELVTDSENGFLISPTDHEDLARRLQQLAADPALRERLGAAGAVRAQQYAPGGVAQKVLATYQETLKRRAAPS